MRRVPQATSTGNDRDRDRGDHVGVQVMQILAALGEVLHQLRAVVGDDDDREPLHRFLEAQLKPGAAVHLREEFLILTFQFDVDAGPQQLTVACNAAGKVILAATHRGAGVHRR